MGIFDGILFCTDLDGTLFNDEKRISAENKAAIEYFQREGGIFTFVTGRMPYFAKQVADIVAPNAPFGCINGGGLYDIEKGAYLWKTGLPDSVLELVRYVAREIPDMGIQINGFDYILFCHENQAMAEFRRATGVENRTCTLDAVDIPIGKIVFGHTDTKLIDRLSELLHAHPRANEFTFIRSELTLFEILPPRMSKDVAMCKLAELLHIDPKKIFAIGDYHNDIGMIRAAGVGVAVANAQPEVIAVADYVTPVDNTHHAIAHVIDQIAKGRFQI